MTDMKSNSTSGPAAIAAGALKALLSEANEAIRERKDLLTSVEAIESRLTDNQQQLASAHAAKSSEESAAVETSDGLAVASERTRRLIDDLELRNRSDELRVKKLRLRVEAANSRILTIWEQIEAAIDTILLGVAARLKQDIDSHIESIGEALMKAAALHTQCHSERSRAAFKFFLNPMRLSNPFCPQESITIQGGMMTSPGKGWLVFHKEWANHQGAKELHDSIQAIKEQVSAVRGLVGRIRA